MKAIIAKYGDEIASGVLASSIVEGDVAEAKELDINGEKINISLAKA